MSSEPPLDVARLLAERGWLERLARRLVRDPSTAEDLAQETLRRALERVEATAHPRGWLASVLRRLGVERARSEGRRAERERSVARPEAADPEAIERAALRRDVVDLLLGLDEPERSAVVLRYLEDVDYETIAARQGISPAAARKRVSRGIERLRARLDQRPGERGAWAVLATPWIQSPAPSVAPMLEVAAPSAAPPASLSPLALPSLTMKISAQVLGAVAVLAIVGATLWQWGEHQSTHALVGPSAYTEDSDGAEVIVAVVSAPIERTNVESRAPSETATALASLEAFPARPPSTVGTLELRVRWSDGTPAAGVGSRVYAWDDPAPRLNVRSVHTDEAGRALVEQLAPGRVVVYIDRARSHSAELVAGRRSVLEVQVPQGFEVRGRVLDPDGRPVAGAEIVLSDYGNDAEAQVVGRSGADGCYVVRDVGEGRSLSARAAGFAPAFAVDLEPRRPGQALELDLKLRAGGAVLAGIVVDASGTPLRGARVYLGPIKDSSASDPGNSPNIELRSDDDGRFTVQGAGAGAHGLAVRSEVHVPWSERIVLEAGGRHDVVVELLEGATLSGKVVRSDGGLALGATVEVTRPSHYRSFSGFSARVDSTGSYHIRGLPPGNVEVRAREDGYGRASGSVMAVAGEPGVWDARLVAERTVKGRVIDERGAPLVGWMVGTQVQKNLWDRRTDSDADGRFELRDVRPDADVLHVTIARGFAIGSVASAPIGEGEVVVQVADAAIPSCSLTLRVLRDGRAPEPAAVVTFHHRESGGHRSEFSDATGHVELTGLRPGVADFTLGAAGAATVLQRVELVAGKRLDLGTFDLVPGGRIAVRVTTPTGYEQDSVGGSARVQTQSGEPIGHINLADGVGTSGPLPPGSYVLVVYGRGIESIERPCAVVNGETTSIEVASALAGQAMIELRVARGDSIPHSLRWSVVDASGGLLPGATRERVDLREGMTRIFVSGLPLGVSTVRVELSDGRAGEVAVEVSAVGPDADYDTIILPLE